MMLCQDATDVAPELMLEIMKLENAQAAIYGEQRDFNHVQGSSVEQLSVDQVPELKSAYLGYPAVAQTPEDMLNQIALEIKNG